MGDQQECTLPTDQGGAEDHCDTLAQICCGGYVFYMADGSRFRRTDVQPVIMSGASLRSSPQLYTTNTAATPSCGVKRKHPCDAEDKSTDGAEDDGIFDLHMCRDEPQTSPSSTAAPEFVVANQCNSWERLSQAQQYVLTEIQARVNRDLNLQKRCSCVIIEGPGGCGKTRLMSHIMNHKRVDTLVLYVTKQNKRVQDFIHMDCLGGEGDPSLQKPLDLSPSHRLDIERILTNAAAVGRFALTAEKLVYALAGLSPRSFHKDTTVSSLRINDKIFDRSYGSEGTAAPHLEHRRNIILMIDEYTMLPPPLIHALAYYVRVSAPYSPLLMLLAGDKLQCGPVGWDDETVKISLPSKERYTAQVRHEIAMKMQYDLLDLHMENLQRCRGDLALGACIKRLRRIAEEKDTRSPKKIIHLVLAKYSQESGVKLYRKETDANGVASMRKVVPADMDALDFDGSGSAAVAAREKDFDEYMSGLEHEELDERGVELELSPDPPMNPMYDMTPLVDHFTRLYTRLAEVLYYTDSTRITDMWPKIVHESVASIRHLFPAFIVLTNTSCNRFAETFLLALSSKVRERVLQAPAPAGSIDPSSERKCTWAECLESTLRRCIRSLKIDEDDAIQRQTLFVGMVYKMTSTFNSWPGCYLCNGEAVVLTSIVFSDQESLDHMDAVMLRKLDRDTDTDLTLHTGRTQNRMTNARKMAIMPFVPLVSENIYQMQGNTMPKDAKAFIDLTNASCNNVYVAISRFQNSASIEGIVISE